MGIIITTLWLVDWIVNLDPAWIALFGTLFGGAGLKASEWFLGRNRVKTEQAMTVRDELRETATQQREEIRQLESDVDKWRMAYYDLRDKYSVMNTDLVVALGKIKEQASKAENKAEQLKRQPPPT